MAQGRKVRLYEWIRIWLTFTVVLEHSLGGGYPSYLHPIFNVLSPGIAHFSGLVLAFNMQMFFTLSGAVLHLRPLEPFDDFVKKKAKRLLIPFWVVGLLSMMIGYDASHTGQALRSFQQGEGVGHLWFLLALFWCMLIYATVLKVLERLHCHSLILPFLLSCLCYGLAVHLGFAEQYAEADFLQLHRTFFYLPWFALGYWLDAERGKVEDLSAAKTVIFIAITVSAVLLEWEDYCRTLLGMALCTLISHLCTLWFAKLERLPVYKLLVRNLFCIYLFHVPLNAIIWNFFMETRLLAYSWGCVLYLVSRTVGVVLLSILMGESCRCIKKSFGKKAAA